MNGLRFQNGPRAGEFLAFDKPRLTFGRKQTCDCVLMHATVSREHFFVERNNQKYFVVDSGSGNGTTVNGERVDWAELKHGDRIQAGPFAFIVEIVDEVSSPRRQSDAEAAEADWPDRDSSQYGGQREYSREYLQGIAHFNAGRYFEAHEVWEEIWLRSTGDEKLFLQMLIQAAVGFHHFERGNRRGARGMYRGVSEKLRRLPAVFQGVDLTEFSRLIELHFAWLEREDDAAEPVLNQPRPRIDLLPTDKM